MPGGVVSGTPAGGVGVGAALPAGATGRPGSAVCGGGAAASSTAGERWGARRWGGVALRLLLRLGLREGLRLGLRLLDLREESGSAGGSAEHQAAQSGRSWTAMHDAVPPKLSHQSWVPRGDAAFLTA
jgi:hypothetical protein